MKVTVVLHIKEADSWSNERGFCKIADIFESYDDAIQYLHEQTAKLGGGPYCDESFKIAGTFDIIKDSGYRCWGEEIK